jgi:AbrB family looped-hinge helix DNA binding protein
MATKSRIVRRLRNGQITIPKEFREALNLDDAELIEVTLSGDALEVRPLRKGARKSNAWLKDLYDAFAPARKSLDGYSEAEIDAAIDEALREVRSTQPDHR